MFSSCAFVFKLHISTMPTPTNENSGGRSSASQSSDSRSPDRHGYSDSHLEVLRAYEDRWEEGGSLPFTTVAMEGMGPFSRGKIWSYLWDLGAEVSEIEDASAPDLLILGRERFSDKSVRRLLQRREGKRLRICSQEMLLAWSMTGVDPNERPQTVETFIEGHPALELVKETLEDKWPGTGPIPARGGGDAEFDGPEKSPLARLGYSVGKTGADQSRRRDALEKTFAAEKQDFPGTYPPGYLGKWGAAKTGSRLQQIAQHIASNFRTSRRKDDDFDTAIRHWESDLQWLKENFYHPLSYGFRWPEMQ